MPNSILMRSIVAALVLATSVAASAAISGRETATELADGGVVADQGGTPVSGHVGLMEIAFETMQIAGQITGYTDPPKHKNISEKIISDASDLPRVKK